MTEPLSESRAREFREALADKVREGEAFTVRARSDGVEVEPVESDTPLHQRHPELHGRLLAANQQIADSTSGAFYVLTLFWIVSCLIVLLGLADSIFGVPLERFQSLWFYLGLGAICFLTFSFWVTWIQKIAYRRRRDDLEAEIERSGLTRERVIASIESDKSLREIAERMKGDASADERRR